MKISSREELKSLIKEVVIELFSEGLGVLSQKTPSRVSESTTPRSRQTQQKPVQRTTAQEPTPQDKAKSIASTLTKNVGLQSVLAETLTSTAFKEQVQADTAPSFESLSSSKYDDEPISPEFKKMQLLALCAPKRP
jgi:hypothetical protein